MLPVLRSDALQRSQPEILRFAWKITGAVTFAKLTEGMPTLVTTTAIATQAVIDTFLGTTSEFDYLAFDATAMGADTIGVIVNCEGQIKKVLYFKAYYRSGTDLVDLVTRGDHASATLTASTLATEVAAGANGNLAFKINFGNSPDFDAETTGFFEVEVAVYLK